MDGFLLTMICLVVHTFPLITATPLAIANRSGLCKNDSCVTEADHGLSFMQLKSQPMSNHRAQQATPHSPCTWTKSTRYSQGTKFNPAGSNKLAEAIKVEDCHMLALVDQDCHCPVSVAYSAKNSECWCATTGDAETMEAQDDPMIQIWDAECRAGECHIFGDPHIRVFDQGSETVNLLSVSESSWRPGESGEFGGLGVDSFEIGDFWLVKSDLVKIQGRYTRVQRRDSKNPFMTAVAIGDSVLSNNVLIIQPANGTVTWNGKEILTSIPSDFVVTGLIEAKYHNKSTIIGEDAHSSQITRGIDIYLPKRDVRLAINRFPRFLGLSVSMSQHAGGKDGVDGQCGNFNGRESDDTPSLVEQRIGGQISVSESFFASMLSH